jgi:hypothetical protein
MTHTITNFNQAQEPGLSIAEYHNIATECCKVACKIIRESSSFFAKKFAQEVVTHYHSCKKATCNYTAYIACNSTEKFLEQALRHHAGVDTDI